MHPVAARLEPGLTELLSRFGYDLVDVAYLHAHGAWVLRVYFERTQAPRFAPFGGGPEPAGAIGVEDCEHVSRVVSAWLDEQDAIPHAYHLEVSSAGLDRVVKREADFERFEGKRCRIRTRDPIENSRAHVGRLAGVRDAAVVLNREANGGTIHIPMHLIERASLEPEFSFGHAARGRHK